MTQTGIMKTPKKLNFDNAILMTNNPILFGMKTAQNMEENFSMFDGETAEFIKQSATEASGVRVMEQEDWEQHGFFIKPHRGMRVVVKMFDITGIRLQKKAAKEKAIQKAKVETVGDVQEQLKAMQLQIEKQAKDNEDTRLAYEIELKRIKEEKEEALTSAGVKTKNDGEVGLDLKAMTKAAATKSRATTSKATTGKNKKDAK